MNDFEKSQETQGKVVAITVFMFVLVLIFGLGYLLYAAVNKAQEKSANSTSNVVLESTETISTENAETVVTEELDKSDDGKTDESADSKETEGTISTKSVPIDIDVVEDYLNGKYFYEAYIEENYDGDMDSFYEDVKFINSYDFAAYRDYIGKPVALYGYVSEIDRENGEVTVVAPKIQSNIVTVKLYCDGLKERNINQYDFGKFYFLMRERGKEGYEGQFLFLTRDYNAKDSLPVPKKSVKDTTAALGISFDIYDYKVRNSSSMVAIIENPEKRAFKGYVSVAYYDANNQFLGSETEYVKVSSMEECEYVNLYGFDPHTRSFYRYDHYEYVIDFQEYEETSSQKDYYAFCDFLEVTLVKEGKRTMLQMKNLGEKQYNRSVHVIMIDKNQKVVGDSYFKTLLKEQEEKKESLESDGKWEKIYIFK